MILPRNQEVLEIKQSKPRAMYIVGDTAKGIRQAAYEAPVSVEGLPHEA